MYVKCQVHSQQCEMNLAGDYTLQEAYHRTLQNFAKNRRCTHEQTFRGQCTFVGICIRRPFLSQSPPQEQLFKNIRAPKKKNQKEETYSDEIKIPCFALA